MKILFLILSILIPACGEKNNEWKMIFDGQKVDGMRGYKMDSFPWESWEIIDGSLKTIPDAKGVDIISEKVFKDFELELEWKIQKGSNSGIFYFASEEGDYIWQSAPEMQVLDNTAHPDRQKKETSAGALYDLIAPKKEMVKPVGQYNKVRIISKSGHIEHWLNGFKLLEYDFGSSEIKSIISKSKFRDMPFFAKNNFGRIGFQGDHGEVWYRNIRIREL